MTARIRGRQVALDAAAADRRRRSGRRLAIGAVVLVVLAAGAAVFALLRQRAATERAIQELAAETAAATHVAEPQREVLVGLLRRIEQRPEMSTDVRLVHSRVRLLLDLQRPQAAWDAVAPLAMAPGAAARDLELGAEALALSYAIRGNADDALRAVDLARRSHQATGHLPPLFLAWQAATWVGVGDTAAALASELRERHAGTSEARLAELYASLDFEQPRAAAAAIEELQEALPRSAEASFLLALVRLHSDVGRERERGIDDLQQVLAQVPAYRDARILAVAAHEMQGRQAQRDAHLQWLLTNAPDDPRRAVWQQRLQTPVR